MKTLVLAEKPSVGRDIARVLKCSKKTNNFIEGNEYIVTWALGHLVTLADPENYNKKYKSWEINDLPIIPEKINLVVIAKTSKQFGIVKDLLHRKDVKDIIIATDAGREGELVARWIIEKAKCNKPIKRLWISSVTDKAINDGFKNLKDGKFYLNLLDSAKARAEADWLVGINATRCLTTKFNSQLSCGRVQTPTLAIIAKREDEIRQFVSQKFYGITAKSENIKLIWHDNKNNINSFDQEAIQKTIDKIQNSKEGKVLDITKTNRKKYPQKLYDLTELQRDSNKKFGFSPKETLRIMQDLYERHKVLTYPRTDSRHITKDIVPTLKDRLKACGVKQYAKISTGIINSQIKINSNFVDDNKVSDHHAIIPTEQTVNFSSLSDDERKIYDLVVIRFLSVFYPPFEYEHTSLKVDIKGETFFATGRVILKKGFTEITKIDDDEDSEDQILPILKKGDLIKISEIKMTEGKTNPPAPFNEATLLTAMENPSKYIESNNKSIKDTLGKTGGLGTVATRADIIEKLYNSFLIEKKGKDIFATSKGRQLLTLVPDELKSPELTGIWEQKLLKISNGELNKNVFINEITNYTKEIILSIKNSNKVYRHDNLSTTKCPVCGKFMLKVNGKKGEMLICQDRECNEKISVSITTRAKCPTCRKFLKIVGEGDKRKVICSCGHNEKYANFEKRMKEVSNKLSKKDVQSYINKLNKEDEKQSPFDSLKGIKFD